MKKNIFVDVIRGAWNRGATVVNNLSVGIISGIMHRDPRVILMGAWMGKKFADNSRFLFQYLSANKEKLGLKKVVWVTRNPDVVDLLHAMGYDALLCGTKESLYWHLKSGVQIVCNATNRQGHEADIDIQYSWGAKKIQLWHGVGMKSVGAIANEHVSVAKSNGLWQRLKSVRFINMLLSEGGWGEAYFLTTSPEKRKTCQAIAACSEKSMFISNYPRNCQCVKLLPFETIVIEKIKRYNGAVIYLPTFRKDYSLYVHPLTNEALRSFLAENNIVWIEKPHSAATYRFDVSNFKNVLCLEDDFDINVLYPYMSAVVSDYSSAVFDAVYRNIPVVMYTPDLEKFKHGNIGLTFDIETNCAAVIARDSSEVLDLLREATAEKFFQLENRRSFYKKYQRDFWSNASADYEKIWADIKEKAHIR